MGTLLEGYTIDPDSASALNAATAFGTRITGAVAETFPRLGATLAAQTLTSGDAVYTAINLVRGQTVGHITFWAIGALQTATHQVFALYDANFAKLAQTADDTSTAWSANAKKTLAISTPYVVPADGLYYVAAAVAASTMPTLAGVTGVLTANLQAPPVAFVDTSNAVGATFPTTAARSLGFASLYAYVAA